MELTIALFFFTLACAVCIQLFVQAHTLNKEAAAVSEAQTICSSVADEYLSGETFCSLTVSKHKRLEVTEE